MKFNNPKLTLFAFHLRNNFSQDKPVEDANFIWKQCQQLGEYLKIPRLQSLGDRLYRENGEVGVNPATPKSDYLELLQADSLLEFSAIPDGCTLQLRGEVYPLQIHDTYAVDITLRFPYSQVELEQLKDLNPQGCLPFDRSISFLGQTLVFFAQPDGKVDDIQALAESCLNSILPETDGNFYHLSTQGQFLGSPIFEYQTLDGSSNIFNSIYIWLNDSSETESLEDSGEYYQYLINLLCCRSKIDYVYAESRRCNQNARSLYRQFAAKQQTFRQLPSDQTQRLQQLKTWLLDLPNTALDYAELLRDLDLHRTAIETNCQNYKYWLDGLDFILLIEDTKKIWQDFITESTPQFIQQLQTDIAYLQPNQPLFQQAIDTIRGTVEIEQAQLDKSRENAAQNRQQRLELFITVVSTGLAVSGLSSQVANEPAIEIISQFFPHHFAPNPQPEAPNYLFSSFSPIAFHLLLGILVAIPFGALVWSLQTNPIRKIVRFLKKSL